MYFICFYVTKNNFTCFLCVSILINVVATNDKDMGVSYFNFTGILDNTTFDYTFVFLF